jgi:hypothetical protein
VLEVVGTNEHGDLYWSEFDGRTPAAPKSRTLCAGHGDGYRAGCLLGPGLVAGVTGRNEIHWLRATHAKLETTASPSTVSVPARVVFLVARGRSSVIAVLDDGSTVRVPGPM